MFVVGFGWFPRLKGPNKSAPPPPSDLAVVSLFLKLTFSLSAIKTVRKKSARLWTARFPVFLFKIEILFLPAIKQYEKNLHVRDLPACHSFLKFEFIFLFVIK